MPAGVSGELSTQSTQVGSDPWHCTIEGQKRLFVRKQ